jgi:hypothetical protein
MTLLSHKKENWILPVVKAYVQEMLFSPAEGRTGVIDKSRHSRKSNLSFSHAEWMFSTSRYHALSAPIRTDKILNLSTFQKANFLNAIPLG